jgi:CubicO group peptidase (beta-lactamase class C family)
MVKEIVKDYSAEPLGEDLSLTDLDAAAGDESVAGVVPVRVQRGLRTMFRGAHQMHLRRRLAYTATVYALGCWLVAFAGAAGAAGTADPRVDRVFAQWNSPDTPGCALGVVRNGALLYSKGYGAANLELNVPITPRTVFDIGSVSKQFTAMSIVLLAQDGKLSLDDDIHQFIPELPAYGAPVTVRSMLHHLSGLRSYTDLLDLVGVPEIDLTTDDDALAVIARQKTLNFPPGRQYLYSDTNYFLLALVVRRVSGETLREFARRRIFEPLGMSSTHFHDDHRMIVPRRANGYSPRPGGGFDIDMSNFEELGDGSVMTTVEDLARWDRNFYAPVVGGKRAIEQLQELGVRSDGSKTPYAMGLVLDKYRGIARVQHTGEWVGYRSSFLRFPRQRLSVILLCNMVGDLDPLALSERVADVYLGVGGPLPAPRTARATVIAPDPPELASFAGIYWNADTFAYLRFVATAGALALDGGDSARPLVYLGHGEFQAANSSTRYAFHPAAAGATVDAMDDDFDPVVLQRVTQEPVQAADLSQYAGTYYNDELGVSWTLGIRNARLTRTQWMFPAQQLKAILPDTFTGDLSEGAYVLRFTRNGAGQVDGFAVGTAMVRPLRFLRCEPADPHGGGPVELGCKIDVRPLLHSSH